MEVRWHERRIRSVRGRQKPTMPVKRADPLVPAKDQPAHRNTATEQALCSAVRHGMLVELTYEDDFHSRAFAPYVVFQTSTGKVCVFGMQVNPSTPNNCDDPRNFEAGKISQVNLTTTKFQGNPRFDLSNARYRNRICPH